MENRIYLSGDYKITNSLEDDNKLYIDGYACMYNHKNLNNEIVTADSFKDFFDMYKAGKINPKLNYNHTSQYIGGINEFHSTKDGLFINAYLNKDVSLVKDMLLPLILDGTISQFSTEGMVKDGYNGICEHEDGSYTVKSFILTDVAIVAHPAEWNATFTVKNYLQSLKEKEFKLKYYLYSM